MRLASSRPLRWTLIVLFALGVRLGVGLWWETRIPEGQRFSMPDSNSYWVLAQKVARGEPYFYGSPELRTFRAPGYPALLAALFVVLGDDDPAVIWARGLNAVLGAAAVLLVGLLAWQLFDETTGLLAAALTALYPGALAMSTFVLSEGPFCPLMVGQLLCWVFAWRLQRVRSAGLMSALGGGLAGLATLVRPSWLLFTPFALLVSLLFPGRRRQAWIGGCMLLGFCLAMSPWWVRNYRVSGAFVPTTLQMGASLYDGWSPQADGSSEMSFTKRFWDEQRQADAESDVPLVGTFEQRLDQRMRTAALTWAANHPGDVVRLAGIKFVRFWNFGPNDRELRGWRFRLVVIVGFVPLLVLGLAGACKYLKRGWPYALCLVPAIYFTLLHMIFVSSIRYRQPAMLTLIVLAAGFLMDGLRRWRRVQSAAVPAALTLTLFTVSCTPT